MQPKPTDEQAQITAAIEAGHNVAVDALAGSGKTFTLLLGAQAKERRLKRGRYVSFGRGNRADAKQRFPGTVECHTSHSLAWEVGKYYQRRLDPKTNRRNGTDLAEAFGTRPFEAAPGRTITAIGVAVTAKEAVGRYARSAARTLEPWHVAAPAGLDGEPLKAFRAHVLPYAKQMWADLHDPHADRAEFDPDHFRKMWALKKPRLDRDCNFIMLDEAQDTDALTLDVLLRQNCQLVAVGDTNQTLYSWRGAVDALEKWPAEQRLHLTESWRFGPEIAEAANAWLEVLDEPLRLTGRGEAGTVGPLAEVDVVLCRTNAGAIAAAAEALAAGRRVGMARSVLDRIKKMCQAAMQLQSGQACDDPLLATFGSWPEVVQYVRLDPTMGELAMLVRMVERFGAAELYRIVRQCKDAARAKTDLVVMTVHQSKGLQWPRVRVGDDFPAPALDADGAVQPADAALLQLCYVACTRASSALDDTALDWIDAYRKGEATETQLEHWYERELRKAGERD